MVVSQSICSNTLAILYWRDLVSRHLNTILILLSQYQSLIQMRLLKQQHHNHLVTFSFLLLPRYNYRSCFRLPRRVFMHIVTPSFHHSLSLSLLLRFVAIFCVSNSLNLIPIDNLINLLILLSSCEKDPLSDFFYFFVCLSKLNIC